MKPTSRTTLSSGLGLIVLTLLLWKPLAFAGIELREFDNDEYRQRYHQLIDELRCLVCQNQNLADSNAQLAQDLRGITYEMIQQGKSDKEIVDYMVARYGEFVLYKPPLDKTTFLLWVGPALLPLILIFFLFRFVRKRAKAAPLALSEEQHRRSQQLLADDDEETKS